jgi:hypothetical protein
MTQYDKKREDFGKLNFVDPASKLEDWHDDLKGYLVVPFDVNAGDKIWIGFKRKSGANGEFFLASRPRQASPAQPAPQAQHDLTPRRPNGRPAPTQSYDLDDEIPF